MAHPRPGLSCLAFVGKILVMELQLIAIRCEEVMPGGGRCGRLVDTVRPEDVLREWVVDAICSACEDARDEYRRD